MEKGIAIYHVVRKHENFDHAANVLFELVKDAQAKHPGKERHLYLDIEGHKNKSGGFDPDMFELQKEYVLGFLGVWLSKISTPLYQIKNPNQSNDIPDEIHIKST